MQLHEHKELFIPQMPLKFDQMGKLLIYQTDELQHKRRFFRMALILPSIALYCGMRAIQKRSWWRILLWSIPSFISSRIMYNALNIMSICVLRMYLKEDGETLVIETMLWEGTPRKHVVKIRDIHPHSEPHNIF